MSDQLSKLSDSEHFQQVMTCGLRLWEKRARTRTRTRTMSKVSRTKRDPFRQCLNPKPEEIVTKMESAKDHWEGSYISHPRGLWENAWFLDQETSQNATATTTKATTTAIATTNKATTSATATATATTTTTTSTAAAAATATTILLLLLLLLNRLGRKTTWPTGQSTNDVYCSLTHPCTFFGLKSVLHFCPSWTSVSIVT